MLTTETQLKENQSKFTEILEYLLTKNIKTKTIIHGPIQRKIIDILPYNADKGLALKYIADKYNIELKQIHACGNSLNDIDMFQLVEGNKMAPYNSHQELIDWIHKNPLVNVQISHESYAASIQQLLAKTIQQQQNQISSKFFSEMQNQPQEEELIHTEDSLTCKLCIKLREEAAKKYAFLTVSPEKEKQQIKLEEKGENNQDKLIELLDEVNFLEEKEKIKEIAQNNYNKYYTKKFNQLKVNRKITEVVEDADLPDDDIKKI